MSRSVGSRIGPDLASPFLLTSPQNVADEAGPGDEHRLNMPASTPSYRTLPRGWVADSAVGCLRRPRTLVVLLLALWATAFLLGWTLHSAHVRRLPPVDGTGTGAGTDTGPRGGDHDDSAIRPRDGESLVNVLQLNDVYELDHVRGGREGGLARVAAWRAHYKRDNPNTFLALAGDLISPSAIAVARYSDEGGGDGADFESAPKISGRHMIDVCNAAGLDWSSVGNHEFDYNKRDAEPTELVQRFAESRFKWLAANVRRCPVGYKSPADECSPFPGLDAFDVRLVRDRVGRSLRLCLFGLSTDYGAPKWAYVDPDFVGVARETVRTLRAAPNHCDVVVALTHLAQADDLALVQEVPDIDLVIGGHEHENRQFWRGDDFTPVTKADANARTGFVHYIFFDHATRRVRVHSHMERLTDETVIVPDASVQALADTWTKRAFDYWRRAGIDATHELARITETLDVTEASVRNVQVKLAHLLLDEARRLIEEGGGPRVDVAIVGGGNLRLDDALVADQVVTRYTVLRCLPFGDGGVMKTARVPGRTLRTVLENGRTIAAGTGAYLQIVGASYRRGDKQWLVAGKPLDESLTYVVSGNDYVMTGGENPKLPISVGDAARGKPVLGDVETVASAPEPKLRATLASALARAYPL